MEHFSRAVEIHQAGGFDGDHLDAYKSRMALLQAMKSGHTRISRSDDPVASPELQFASARYPFLMEATMPDDKSDALAGSPKDTATGTVQERPGAEAEAHEAPPEPNEGTTPAGQRNSAFPGEREGADHDTEEAAAYRENDA